MRHRRRIRPSIARSRLHDPHDRGERRYLRSAWAYLLLYPHARVLVAIPLGFYIHTARLPAAWVLGFWFVIQLLSSVLAGAQQGGVAFRAHLGGFILGAMLIPFFKRKGIKLFHPGRRHPGMFD